MILMHFRKIGFITCSQKNKTTLFMSSLYPPSNTLCTECVHFEPIEYVCTVIDTHTHTRTHTLSLSLSLSLCFSAGVGRTGTLIAVDVELQRAQKEGVVDPFNYILKMREQRNHIVQTEVSEISLIKQYIQK